MEKVKESLDQAVAANPPQRRFRMVPVRYLLPNLITLLALCSGVTAIRLALEARYELSVACVMLAVVLDAVDGRLARLLKGTSRFGAELDSLADFVNFGVAPAILLYVWSLNSLKTLGWVICLVLAIACALRLARFNVALDDPNKPAWASRFFIGAPAPAGAGLALLPFYLGRIPTFSGKHMGFIPGDKVLPVLGLAVLAVIMLIAYPWEFLTIVSIAYLALIPVSMRAHRRLQSGAGSTAPPEP